jgi:hypothetical protein
MVLEEKTDTKIECQDRPVPVAQMVDRAQPIVQEVQMVHAAHAPMVYVAHAPPARGDRVAREEPRTSPGMAYIKLY